MNDRNHISVTLELEELRAALEGIRVMADSVATQGARTPEDDEQATIGVPALLAIVSERMGLLLSAMRGNTQAKLLLAPHNRAAAEPEEQSVLDGAWCSSVSVSPLNDSAVLRQNGFSAAGKG